MAKSKITIILSPALIMLLALWCYCGSVIAEEASTSLTSSELITKAWASKGASDAEAALRYTNEVIALYKEQADREQASLKGFPARKPDIESLQVLNDVGTAYFIQGETYRDLLGNAEEAVKAFKTVLYNYCYAQSWDQRGWFWKVARASKDSIIKLMPNDKLDPCPCGSLDDDKKTKPKKQISQLPTQIVLYDAGKEDFIDYEKYGVFQDVGTKDYKYIIKDQEGLSQAVGEGIYPNTTSVRWDPEFKKVSQEKRLDGSHWDFVHSPDLEAAFLKWCTASEPQGVRLFYIASILEKSGLIKHALKCYYAIVVHFPGTYGWTYWHTPWYVGQAAIAKINYLLYRHPELGYRLEGSDIKVLNGYDTDISNDVVITTPGKFVKIGLLDKFKPKPATDLVSIKKRRGKGKVHLLQYETGDWQLIVDNKPYIIKGITYAATKVGQSPDNATLGNWMEEDANRNNRSDGPYDAFVDSNNNNIKDKKEPVIGDFRLMKQMGVNTIRLYHQTSKVNKEVLRDLYKNYGIMVIMGDFFGKYTIGSGAPWNPGTDYNSLEHKKNMINSVKKMVNEFKDEPYILFWLLGNENVYGYACNADKEPDAFFKFADEVAGIIKEIDPEHPVAICNGDTLYLDKFGKDTVNIDIFGVNSYRGDYGFGRLWKSVKENADRPVFITEFGCPAYCEGKSLQEAEELQADYHRGCWEDIELNMAFDQGAGNSLGGVVFEWMDEWWKQYEPFVHDELGVAMGPFPDGYFHEEWFGICGQGDGKNSPFLRHLRKAYFMYKKKWR